MRQRVFYIYVFLMLCSISISAQNMEYDIIWLGKIGKLYISQTKNSDSLIINTLSEVKIPFYKFNWITDTKAVDGKLLTAEYKQLLNEKKREGARIKLKSNDKWNYTDNDGTDFEIEIHDQLYVSKLYFQEPVDQKFIFSERFGIPLELISNGNGHYKLLLPDNNYCEYFYENGICKMVKAKNGSRTIKMVLADDT